MYNIIHVNFVFKLKWDTHIYERLKEKERERESDVIVVLLQTRDKSVEVR